MSLLRPGVIKQQKPKPNPEMLVRQIMWNIEGLIAYTGCEV